jgi:hypothetical protein
VDGFVLPTENWSAFCHRIKDEYRAGWLPAKHRDVALAIANLNMAGDWTPTTRKIAVEAACSSRTVRRARATLEGRGLLAVRARFEIVDGRAQQRANEYGLVVPTEPVMPKPRIIRGGQTGRPIQGSKKKTEEGLVNKWLFDGNRAGPAALAARREVFLARQAAEQASRHQI